MTMMMISSCKERVKSALSLFPHADFQLWFSILCWPLVTCSYSSVIFCQQILQLLNTQMLHLVFSLSFNAFSKCFDHFLLLTKHLKLQLFDSVLQPFTLCAANLLMLLGRFLPLLARPLLQLFVFSFIQLLKLSFNFSENFIHSCVSQHSDIVAFLQKMHLFQFFGGAWTGLRKTYQLFHVRQNECTSGINQTCSDSG